MFIKSNGVGYENLTHYTLSKDKMNLFISPHSYLKTCHDISKNIPWVRRKTHILEMGGVEY